MEIVQVVGFYPPHLGGQEAVVERLARMQADSHRVTVYTSDIGAGPGPATDAAPPTGGPVRVVRDRTWVLARTPVVPRLPLRLLRHRPAPDLLHVHVGQALIPELVALVARLRRVPYVAHVHLVVGPSGRLGGLLLPAYQRLFLSRVLRGAARVVCLTDAMRAEVVRAFRVPAERIAVVPNGVDGTEFPAGDAAGRAPAELLVVGRLDVQKNVRVAVEAMRSLPRDVVLRIVGDGELREELIRLAIELELPNVRFAGRLGPQEVAAAYRRATVVLVPSEREGVPLVLLEALSAGAPVICSALPELVEVGGPAVVPVDPVTPETIAAAVRALLDDPARRAELSAAARRRAADFGWPAVTAAVDAVYAEVLAENEPAGVRS
jgi:glycosyltransferase involved in cell wall biosynthesis